MKKLSLTLVLSALVLAGCGMVSAPATQAPTTPQVADSAHKNYELYEGAIWSAAPFECGGDIICLINRAQNCTPSRGRFIAEYRDTNQRFIRENYEIGVQGTQFNFCQMYFKKTNELINSKAPKFAEMPLADMTAVNYQMCRFTKASDIADIIRQGPKDAGSDYLVRGFLDEAGMFSTKFDLNGTKNTKTYVELASQCFKHTIPNNEIKLTSVNYNLVAGEGIEDASQNLRLTVDSLDASKATITLIKNDKKESATISKDEEKTVLGFKIKVTSFSQKNVAKPDASSTIKEPAVSFTISL